MEIKPKTLLIASPELLDPYFRRSVVLILIHDDETTVGLVLNTPSKIDCQQIMSQFNLKWNGPHKDLLVGGPVDPKSLWMLHSDGWSFEHTSIFRGLSVSRSEEALSALCHAEEQRLRVFVGYAQWGPGQLKREIEEGAWWTVEVDADFVFDTEISDLWSEALARLGVDSDSLYVGQMKVH